MKSTLAFFAVMTLGLLQAELLSQQPYPTGSPVPYQTMPVQNSIGSASHMMVPAPTPQSITAQPGTIAQPNAAQAAQATPSMTPAPMPSSDYTAPNTYSPSTVYPGATSYPAAGVPTMSGVGCDMAGCDSPGGCDSCGDLACDGGCGGIFSGSGLFSGMGLLGNNGPVRPARVWGSIEYLHWWNKNRRVPVLATTGTVASGGVLGQPGTETLFGYDYDDDAESGVRFNAGWWFNSYQTIGIFGRAFTLEEDIDANYASDGSTVLARPFFNVSTGLEDSLLVGSPNISRGQLAINTTNEITGFDVLLRKMLYYGECNRIDIIGGYHNTSVDDRVAISHNYESLDPLGRVPVGTVLATNDVFEAENEFNGGSIGLMSQGYDGRLTWNLLTKISFGTTEQTVTINGNSSTTNQGGTATSNQGLLALNTNSGVYEQDEFTIVPEIDFSVAYHLSSSLQVSVGYSAIYWSNVALAGTAIDRAINPTQIGGNLIGAARPSYAISDESFWVQGITFGVHGRF